jgi:methanethiol S-methyltransferase
MNYFDHVLQLGITALIWAGWCVIHSLLNSEGIVGKALPPGSSITPYYRIVYSLFAAITLALVYWITPREGDVPLWEWHGPLVVVQGAIWIVALAIGYLSFRLISIWGFLGITALGISRNARKSSDKLITSGIYRETRNPQFLAVLLLLWARDLTSIGLVINIILSFYLIIGARIEEKRLVRKFGDICLKYMSRVPRFIPRRIPSLKSLVKSDPSV